MGVLFALALLVSQAAADDPRPDRAVLIGVTHAPQTAMHALSGPPNDVADLRTVLDARHFHVEDLTEEKATRKAILELIQLEASKVGKDGKFVVYFSGHGYRQAGTLPTIMPWDATSTTNLISVKELYEAVHIARQASSRTVLIDACYSGGLILKNAETGTAVGRGYSSPGEVEARNGPIMKNAQPAELARPKTDGFEGQKDVTYFVAAREEEQAWEDKIGPDGKTRGFFSYSLGNALRNRQSISWSELERDVREDVSGFMAKYRPDQHQEPTASNGVGPIEVFGSRKLALAPRVPQIFDVLLQQKPDPSLTITASSDKAEIPAGESVQLTVHTDKPGYLFVVSEEGSKASLYWPNASGTFDLGAAKIPDKKTFPLGDPAFRGTRFTRFGPSRLTAVRFDDEEQAGVFLAAFLKKNPEELKKQFAKIPAYATASYTANVTNILVGGLIVTDPAPVFEALKDDFDQAAYNDAFRAQKSGDKLAFGAAVICGVNTLFRTAASRTRFDLPDKLDEAKAPEAVREKLKGAEKLTEDEKIVLLGAILAANVPKAFEPLPAAQAAGGSR